MYYHRNNISSFNDICYMLLTYLGLDQTPGAETKHISTNTQTYNLLLCIVTDRPQSY